MRNASRASRHASSARAASRGATASTGRSALRGASGAGERVAVHRLDRGHAFEQQVDARPARLPLVPLLDEPAQTLGVAIRVAVALHLGVELGEIFALAVRDDRGRRIDRTVELLGERERGRAVAIERGRVRRRTRPAARRAGPRSRGRGELTPREPGREGGAVRRHALAQRARPAGARRRPHRSRRARQRERMVGSRSSATAVTRTTTVRAGGSSSVFSIALADSFWLPRRRSASNKDEDFALALDRCAGSLGEHPIANVFLHPVRRRARFELDDIGMHPSRARAAGPVRRHRHRSAGPRTRAPRPRRRSHAARRAGTRATGASRRAPRSQSPAPARRRRSTRGGA